MIVLFKDSVPQGPQASEMCCCCGLRFGNWTGNQYVCMSCMAISHTFPEYTGWMIAS